MNFRKIICISFFPVVYFIIYRIMTNFYVKDALNFTNNHYPAEVNDLNSIDGNRQAVNKGSTGSFKSFILDKSQNKETKNTNLLNYIISTKEKEFCDYQNLSVFIGTYNVNGQVPGVSLKAWLGSTLHPPDIYAVGFQELDLSNQVVFFDSTPKEHDWAASVKKALHSNGTYAELKRVRLVGMFLLIYIKTDLVQMVDHKSLDSVTVGTGLLNRMGNKGGVAIRFQIQDTKICFVCSHLAAGSEELMRRNQDYQEICKISFFQYRPNDRVNIFDHDYLFWLGDLNYRLQDLDNGGLHLDVAMVKKACHARDYDHLLKYDQLKHMQNKNLAFKEFKEGRINFLPTYKYDPGTDIWDTSEKCRVPAWTDRILWIGDDANQTAYGSVPALKISDHKPVFATFTVPVKKINEEKYKKVYEMALKEADRLENEYLPQVAVDRNDFRFENVKFLEPQSQNLTVTNTGQVPVQYNFRPKQLDGKEYCKPWLLVTPDASQIKVGDKREITITILVDKVSVHDLNIAKENLEDILILHLEGGKDVFLTVSGTFLSTSFGQSLEALVKLAHPVRSVPVGQLIDLTDNAPLPTVPAQPLIDVPKELHRLVDHIYKYGLDEPDLLAESGCQSDVLAICEALDTGYPERLPGSIYSVVEALMRFLDSLPDSVIPSRFTELCLKESRNWFTCKKIIKELPEVNRKVFEYLIKFFKEVLAHGPKNGANVNLLAARFAPLLLRLGDKASPATDSLVKARLENAIYFIKSFLSFENFDD